MKKLLVVLIVAVALFSCTPKDQFKISGKIDGLETEQAFMAQILNDSLQVVDSCVVTEGSFSFTGTASHPDRVFISFKGINDMELNAFVEPGTITISGNMETPEGIVVAGTPTQDVFNQYTNGLSPFQDKLKKLADEYYAARDAADEAKMGAIVEQYNAQDSLAGVYSAEFIKANPQSVVTAYIVVKSLHTYELEELEKIAAQLPENLNEATYVKILKEYVAKLQLVAVGQPAIDFTQNDTEGNPFSLSSLKGQWVLVDFWASWCSPCRAENPNVVAVYNEFKEENFTVLGVSFDQSKEAWLGAIEADGLTWSHVSELKGWRNAVGEIYAIKSIPQNILLNPEGIIVAKNLRGEDLRTKLVELIK
ncbi:MAG: AhpC/TSA family protein [Bacteroidales bacterium]|nr:AhpC/TSA family protein [Bacteroidales bacterium]